VYYRVEAIQAWLVSNELGQTQRELITGVGRPRRGNFGGRS
jgi:hypothetical protein